MSKQEAATPAPQEPAPMTREWCAAYPGAAAGIINRLARQVDATWPVATGYAEGKVHMAPSVAPQEPAGWRLVPLPFIQGVCDLAHNYSFTAIPPDYYRGVEGDAFKDAYRRCGRELAKVRAMLTAAPQEPAEPAYTLSEADHEFDLWWFQVGQNLDWAVSIYDIAKQAYVLALTSTFVTAEPRSCTCHPDDNPPRPCPQKYALSECRAATQSVADAQDAPALTDEQIDDICKDIYGSDHGGVLTASLERAVARAIESAITKRDPNGRPPEDQ
jgi:hypothetical protein